MFYFISIQYLGNNVLANLAIQLQLNYYNDELSQKDRHLGVCKLVEQVINEYIYITKNIINKH